MDTRLHSSAIRPEPTRYVVRLAEAPANPSGTAPEAVAPPDGDVVDIVAALRRARGMVEIEAPEPEPVGNAPAGRSEPTASATALREEEYARVIAENARLNRRVEELINALEIEQRVRADLASRLSRHESVHDALLAAMSSLTPALLQMHTALESARHASTAEPEPEAQAAALPPQEAAPDDCGEAVEIPSFLKPADETARRRRGFGKMFRWDRR